MGLKDRVALVTGSTSGIGHGIARAMAEAGAHVMLNGFGDPAAIAALKDELGQAHGIRVGYHGADMSRPDEVAALVQAAHQQLGGVDILVNNAGIQHTAPIESFPKERWDAVIAINLSAAFHAMQAAIPGMKAGGWGRIINIASAHGLVASAQKSAYVAAKHGLEGLSKTIALEGGGRGVTSNCVNPSYVRTPLVEKQITEQAKVHGIPEDRVVAEIMLAEAAVKRLVEPAEVADLVLWLTGDTAAMVNGASYTMDGGWTAK